MKNIELIKQKLTSSDIEVCIEGVDETLHLINNLSTMLFEILKNGKFDNQIITEKLSLINDSYLKLLLNSLLSKDKELRFWSATLIIHYNNDDNSLAEQILLDRVENGDVDKAEIASTLLFRKKNKNLIHAITNRLLKFKNISSKENDFFKEKIEMIGNGW